MEILLKLNPGHLAILTVLLNFLGWIIKAIPGIANYWIPLVLAVAGSVSHCILAGWTGENALLGICAAASAVYGHQFTRSLIDSTKANSGPSVPPVAILTACLLLFTGCSTTSQPVTPARVERSVDAAVGIFATIQIREKPQSRPKFVAAQAGLNALVSQEKWDIAAFGEALAATGATEVTGSDIVLIVETSVTLIDIATGGSVDLSNVEYAKAVIVGGQKALNRVLSRPVTTAKWIQTPCPGHTSTFPGAVCLVNHWTLITD